jgi:hypothetical protein
MKEVGKKRYPQIHSPFFIPENSEFLLQNGA